VSATKLAKLAAFAFPPPALPGRPLSRLQMHCFISRLALRDQLRPLRRRQVAADQVFVDVSEPDNR
jgi:hypothetical protein